MRLCRRIHAPAYLSRWLWYVRQVGSGVDRRFYLALVPLVLILAAIGAVLVTIIEKPLSVESLGASVNWSLLTLVGRAPAGYVTTAPGWVVYWVLVLFGVTLVGTITAAIVAAVVNFLLKEGQGMGVSGFRDHVVVCGWNGTARDLIRELKRDNPAIRIALIHDSDRNPAGEGVYYIKGDSADAGDLRRAGIEEAAAAVVFPLTSADDADMRSILVVLTIQSLAPEVRVVAEVNDPRHIDHFRRAGADELLVTSHLASRLLARSAVYPGLANIVSDLVSSGGSELYAVKPPTDTVGLSMDEATYRLRTEHQATLVAVRRDGRISFQTPREFALRATDDLVVIAEHLGRLVPASTPIDIPKRAERSRPASWPDERVAAPASLLGSSSTSEGG
jgi:voltage-gated potassium channel